MTEIITRIRGLRAKFGTQKRILLQKMDTKSAFREVGVAPDRAAAFDYRLEDLIFIDLRLQLGWNESPGWWVVVASAIQEAKRATTRASAGTSAAANELIIPWACRSRRGRLWSRCLWGAGYGECNM